MITDTFLIALFATFIFGVFAVCLLIYGIYFALTEHDKVMFGAILFSFIASSGLFGIMLYEARMEYNDAIPENQVEILKQKISDAEKEYQKYLIDHPELKRNNF